LRQHSSLLVGNVAAAAHTLCAPARGRRCRPPPPPAAGTSSRGGRSTPARWRLHRSSWPAPLSVFACTPKGVRSFSIGQEEEETKLMPSAVVVFSWELVLRRRHRDVPPGSPKKKVPHQQPPARRLSVPPPAARASSPATRSLSSRARAVRPKEDFGSVPSVPQEQWQ
jgi:hypothetical protein